MTRVVKALVPVVIVHAIAGCAQQEEAVKTDKPALKTPEPERSFTTGVAISPASALVEWLAAHQHERIRLPITLKTGLRPRDAFIGVDPAEPGRIDVHLDDSAMGISLDDRLRHLWPDDGECSVWLEGRWGSTLPVELRGGKAVFSVFAVRGLVEKTAAPLVALIEVKPVPTAR